MKTIRPYRKLEVYIAAKQLVKEVYNLLKKFPMEERYAACDQLRRSVLSVPSNIAEGLGRFSSKEQLHFIEIAYGSLMEVESQLDVSTDLGYITESDFDNAEELIDRVARLLSGLRAKRLSSNP